MSAHLISPFDLTILEKHGIPESEVQATLEACLSSCGPLVDQASLLSLTSEIVLGWGARARLSLGEKVLERTFKWVLSAIQHAGSVRGIFVYGPSIMSFLADIVSIVDDQVSSRLTSSLPFWVEVNRLSGGEFSTHGFVMGSDINSVVGSLVWRDIRSLLTCVVERSALLSEPETKTEGNILRRVSSLFEGRDLIMNLVTRDVYLQRPGMFSSVFDSPPDRQRLLPVVASPGQLMSQVALSYVLENVLLVANRVSGISLPLFVEDSLRVRFMEKGMDDMIGWQYESSGTCGPSSSHDGSIRMWELPNKSYGVLPGLSDFARTVSLALYFPTYRYAVVICSPEVTEAVGFAHHPFKRVFKSGDMTLFDANRHPVRRSMHLFVFSPTSDVPSASLFEGVWSKKVKAPSGILCFLPKW